MKSAKDFRESPASKFCHAQTRSKNSAELTSEPDRRAAMWPCGRASDNSFSNSTASSIVLTFYIKPDTILTGEKNPHEHICDETVVEPPGARRAPKGGNQGY